MIPQKIPKPETGEKLPTVDVKDEKFDKNSLRFPSERISIFTQSPESILIKDSASVRPPDIELVPEENKENPVLEFPTKSEKPQESRFNYYKNEILVGIVVGFVIIPNECAYAFIANFDPSVALHSSWIIGLVTSVFGGRPGMINGLTGGLASLNSGFVTPPKNKHSNSGKGIEEFFVATMIAGVILTICGLLKLGKFQIMIPATVKVGFCNGLAIIIARGQGYAFFDENKNFLEPIRLVIVIIYIVVTAFIFVKFPKLKYKWVKIIPSALVCMVFIVFLEFAVVRNLGYSTLTLKDVAPFSSDNAYPRPFFINNFYDMSAFNSESANRIIVHAIMIACMSVLETTMTKEVVDEYTHSEGDLNKEFLAIGPANVISGFLGASIGSSLLGLSTINCVNGGKGRISSFTAAFLVMIIMFGAYPLLNFMPLGVLVGMLFVVVYRTFRWFTITAIIAEVLPKKWREKLKIHTSRMEILDLLTIIIVTVLTIVVNLLIASVVGIIISGLAFAYRNSFTLEVKSEIRMKNSKKIKVYMVEGPVYYATKKTFFKFFDVHNDPLYVQIDFDHDLFMDYTFIEALNKLCKKYKDSGRDIKIKKLKRTAQKTVEKFHKFVNNIEFIEEKIDLPDVPEFIENNPMSPLERIEERPEEGEMRDTEERFQNLDEPERESRAPPIFQTNNNIEQQTENNA